MVLALLAGPAACGKSANPSSAETQFLDAVETASTDLNDSGPADTQRRNDKGSDSGQDFRTDELVDVVVDSKSDVEHLDAGELDLFVIPDADADLVPPDVPDILDIPDAGAEDLLDDEMATAEIDLEPEIDLVEGDSDSADVEQPEFPFDACGEAGGNGLDNIPMCPVPEGTFWMGTPDGECDQWAELFGQTPCYLVEDTEQPFHEVKLAAFAIDQVEIRASQYQLCIDAEVCSLPSDIALAGGGGGGRDGKGTLSGTITFVGEEFDPNWELTMGLYTNCDGNGMPNALQTFQPLTPVFSYTFADITPGEYCVGGMIDNFPPMEDTEGEPGDEDLLGLYPTPAAVQKVTIIAEQITGGIDFEVMPFPQFKEAALGNTLDTAPEENMPINGADWGQLKTYCEWAGKRLCTEAEWAKAAKGETHQTWPWGNDWHDGWGNTWESAAVDGFDWVAPIGSYPQAASPYGVLDMDANLMEFVQDWYGASYYSVSPLEDPKGPCDALSPCPDAVGKRVLRGTSWRIEVSSGFGADFDSRAAFRTPYPAAGGLYDDVGGRCCVTVE